MTIAHHCIFLVILAFLELLNVASGSTQACLPVGPRKNGMNINFYEYSLDDSTTYSDPQYMAYKYSDTKKLGSVSGQTHLSIYYDPNTGFWNTASWSSDLFGFYTTPTNVTVEMTGYFLPPQTGSYTFFLQLTTLQFYRLVVTLRSNVVHKNNLLSHQRISLLTVLNHGAQLHLPT
ncbi:Flo9p [Saccharomyces cerevisiae FostersB]|nr:Flo9p [Saccharomyces cerevisiae FostersB]